MKKPKVKNKSLKTCKTKGGEVEIYLKEADVPLVGCFANDTENRFTAGIDNNSEEKKKSLVLPWATVTCISCFIMHSSSLTQTLRNKEVLEFGENYLFCSVLRRSQKWGCCYGYLMFEDGGGATNGWTSSDVTVRWDDFNSGGEEAKNETSKTSPTFRSNDFSAVQFLLEPNNNHSLKPFKLCHVLTQRWKRSTGEPDQIYFGPPWSWDASPWKQIKIYDTTTTLTEEHALKHQFWEYWLY